MIDFSSFYSWVDKNNFQNKFNNLKKSIEVGSLHGDLPDWQAEFNKLPLIENPELILNEDVVCLKGTTDVLSTEIEKILLSFSPWRKGPFQFLDVFIDTEWRSDFKWNRVKSAISPLDGKRVLDVGCGSGYHLFRMLGENAKIVIGIDPKLLSVIQFLIFKKYADNLPAWVLPITLEAMPENMSFFDTVFSMGVLYHRRSPFDHLYNLKAITKPGGEVIIETLVIEGKNGEVLVPENRYAKMRNVWFIPSELTLENWLKRAGFEDIKLINSEVTSVEEQRSTKWMTWESLDNFLDKKDKTKTVEGYPAPRRAIFIAKVPG